MYICTYTHIHIPTMDNIQVPHKKKEVLPFAMTWMDLQIIMLGSKSGSSNLYME